METHPTTQPIDVQGGELATHTKKNEQTNTIDCIVKHTMPKLYPKNYMNKLTKYEI